MKDFICLPSLGRWDLLLAVVVCAQATILAYLYEPKWKAFVYALPLPFTFAALAVGRRIDATNVLGLVLLIGFTQGVRVLREKLRLPIVAAIALATAGYSVAGWLLAEALPADGRTFWWCCLGALALAVVMLKRYGPRSEQGHASALPVWVKVPLTALLILSLMTLKSLLQGFATMFPMVGVFAAYEARHSLWTLGRQVPVLMLKVVPMMAASRLSQPSCGLGGSLAVGWAVFLLLTLVELLIGRPPAGSAHGPRA